MVLLLVAALRWAKPDVPSTTSTSSFTNKACGSGDSSSLTSHGGGERRSHVRASGVRAWRRREAPAATMSYTTVVHSRPLIFDAKGRHL
jgi:hypothetical protein